MRNNACLIVSPPHVLLQPEVWGAGAVSIPTPLCVHVLMCACMCVSLLLASVFYLISNVGCCPLVKDVTQRWAEGMFFPFLIASRRGEGVAFSPAGLYVTPRRGRKAVAMVARVRQIPPE